MKIDRILFWFKDGNQELIELNKRFYGLSVLLGRLLNKYYVGKKIKFINLDLATENTYDIHKNLPKNRSYYYGGHLRFYGVFDRQEFESLSFNKQKLQLWEKTHEFLSISSRETKNLPLMDAVNKAFKEGLDIELNTNLELLKTEFESNGAHFTAFVIVMFDLEHMTSKIVLKQKDETVFEKEIDKTENGVEMFLDIYKKIEKTDNYIVIKGHGEIDYLPLKISLKNIPSLN